MAVGDVFDGDGGVRSIASSGATVEYFDGDWGVIIEHEVDTGATPDSFTNYYYEKFLAGK